MRNCLAGGIIARPATIAMPLPESDVSEITVPSRLRSDAEREIAQLKDALELAEGNKARAARLLNMPRSTYYSKLKKYGIGDD